MRKVSDAVAVEDAVVGMADRLVHGMLAHADGGEPDVELADVHRVQRGSEGRLPGVQHILEAYRVVLQAELGYEHLRLDDVLDQPIVLVLAVRREHIAVRAIHVRPPAEHRDHAGHVAVTDVELATRGSETAPPSGVNTMSVECRPRVLAPTARTRTPHHRRATGPHAYEPRRCRSARSAPSRGW